MDFVPCSNTNCSIFSIALDNVWPIFLVDLECIALECQEDENGMA